jgi:hypothetical protein
MKRNRLAAESNREPQGPFLSNSRLFPFQNQLIRTPLPHRWREHLIRNRTLLSDSVISPHPHLLCLFNDEGNFIYVPRSKV